MKSAPPNPPRSPDEPTGETVAENFFPSTSSTVGKPNSNTPVTFKSWSCVTASMSTACRFPALWNAASWLSSAPDFTVVSEMLSSLVKFTEPATETWSDFAVLRAQVLKSFVFSPSEPSR